MTTRRPETTSPDHSSDTDAALVAAALARDPGAARALVERVQPVIRNRVTRALLRYPGARQARDLRPEIEDLTQEVLVLLFSSGRRGLGGWQPGRGLSLRGFVGMVAERRAVSLLRTTSRNPWNAEPKEPRDLEVLIGGGRDDGVHEALAARRKLRRVLTRMNRQLSTQGAALVRPLLIEQRPIEELTAATGLKRDALYAWRSRLRKLARRVAVDTGAAA